MTSPRLDVDDLCSTASTLLERGGVPAGTATLVARSLVDADRAGIYSHGLLRLPLYLKAVHAGGIDPTSEPQVVRRHGAVTVLDGAGCFGQRTMQLAVETAAEAARTHGIATVAVQGSTHYGAGRFWVQQLTSQGLAGVLTSTTGPSATPFGGSRAILGTNPLTIGLPSTGAPLMVDMATTAGAYGKVVAARNEGTPIPAGWAVDATGTPTTDPASVLEGGALLPFGGHKGSGIAVLVEGLSAALTTASFAFRTVDIWHDASSRMNTGHLLIAMDLAAFGDADPIRAKVAELQDEVRSSNPHDAVLSPGDLEDQQLAANARTVELAESTLTALAELAAQHDLPFPTPSDPGSPR